MCIYDIHIHTHTSEEAVEKSSHRSKAVSWSVKKVRFDCIDCIEVIEGI
jgi:hypothetical protein